MPDSPSGGEKTEQPTPKRLEDARKEGQVSLSMDLNTGMLLVIGMCGLAVLGPRLTEAMAGIIRLTLTDLMYRELTIGTTIQVLIITMAPVGGWVVALAVAIMLSGLGLSIAQVGLHASAKPLVPKLARINPLSGLQRLFGMRGLMRFAFSLMKLTLILVISWMVLKADIGHMVYISPDIGLRFADDAHGLWWLGMKLSLVLAAIGAADFMYQRYQHVRDLMMTKQEVKDEYKQSEGDPHVKQRIRQIQRQMAQKRMMQEVPKADVIITNPTHVAVALKYDKEKMAAPVVLAKGYDDVAQRIKAIAAEHNIPMVENIPLARALAKEAEVGKAIPVTWYQAVAEILAAVYRLRKGGG